MANEHIHVMPLLCFFWILALLARRVDSLDPRTPDSWKRILMIPWRKCGPVLSKHFRGTAFCEFISAFFMRVMVLGLQKHLRRSVFARAIMFATEL